MANKKSKKTQKPSRNKKWLKYSLIAVVAALFLVPGAYQVYQKNLDKADAERFATLKSDFQKLQAEFNKIDPGWEYSEGCSETGAAFGEGIKSCKVILAREEPVQNVESKLAYIKTIKERLSLTNEELKNSTTESIFGFDENRFTSVGRCVLRLSDISGKESNYLSCSYESRGMYFSRTDQ